MNESSFLPSKRFTLVVGSILLVGIIVGGVVLYKKSQRTNLFAGDPALIVQEIRKSAEDKDGDGLTDWEEELWGTEIQNPDTDGDGAIDGEEVKNDRDPLKPGPDDAISPSQSELVYKIPTTQVRANSTNRFVQSSLPNALLLANRSLDGEPLTQGDIDELIGPYVPPETVSVTTYQTSDLEIAGNSLADLQNYSEALTQIIDTYKNLVGDELPLIADVMKTGDVNKLLALRSTAIRYESFASDLKNIPVPSSLVSTHLEAMNWYASVSGSLLGLSEVAADPLRGLIGLREYKISIENAETSLSQLLTVLAERALEAVE